VQGRPAETAGQEEKALGTGCRHHCPQNKGRRGYTFVEGPPREAGGWGGGGGVGVWAERKTLTGETEERKRRGHGASLPTRKKWPMDQK